MLLYGRAALSDVELVALVLGGGRSMARGLALLEGFGGIGGLEAADPHELCHTPGVGQAGAAALCAAFELGRRAQQLSLPHATPVRSPQDVSAFVRAMLGPASQEIFVILGLDARQRVRMVRTVAVGTLSQVDVHPREVFRPLVRGAMHSVIVVHNHPSGEAQPRNADIELTHRLADVGRLVGIPLLDHLVVTRKDMVSLASLGLLPGA
jgi:DNA repair protein RadC